MEKINYYNPATGESIGEIQPHSKEDVLKAFEKSSVAFTTWSKKSIEERIKHLRKGRLWLMKNIDSFVDAISLNNGKPKVEALMADVSSVLSTLKHLEKYTEKYLEDEAISVFEYLPQKKAYLTFSPLGVIGVISPWNYPFSLPMGEVFGALAAGNTVLLKPSEVTGLVAKKIQDLMNACELPDGVFQILMGGAETGATLTSLPLGRIIFTGSVATGKRVMKAAADNLVPISLELGGKDPAIVLDDADIDIASSGVLAGGFYNCGQTCASIERLLVHKKIEKEFIQALTEKAKKLRVGPSTSFDNEMGPITYPLQKEIIKKQLDEYSGGSTNLYDGKSNFLNPIIIKANDKHSVWNDETFGPVIAYDTFETEDEAIEKANRSGFGLASVIWSGSNTRARKIARHIYAGTVVINDAPFTNAVPALPWGGVKDSGLGRVHGKEGLRDLCLSRVVVYDIQGQAKQLWWFPYSKNHYEFMKAFVLFLSSSGLSKLFALFSMLAKGIKTEKRL